MDGVQFTAVVLDAPDPRALARFYATFLGWPTLTDEPGWVHIAPPGGGTGLSFQSESAYRAPHWPAMAGEQGMMMHLDLRVDDLEAAVARASGLGAKVAEYQPQSHVRVMLDPTGHPFCLYVEAGEDPL